MLYISPCICDYCLLGGGKVLSVMILYFHPSPLSHHLNIISLHSMSGLTRYIFDTWLFIYSHTPP